MRKVGFLTAFVLLVLLAGIPSNAVLGQEPPPVQIQVNGRPILLRYGKNVHPQTYDLLVQDSGFASRMDWVFMDGMWIPLARGVSGIDGIEDSLPLFGPEYPLQPDYTLQSTCPALNLGVIPYNQCASPWGGTRLFNNPGCWTMCQGGCAITSAAMVFRFYGASIDPGQVNSCCGSNGCYTSPPACGLAWQCAGNNCSGNRAGWGGYHAFTWERVCSMVIYHRRPPIVRLSKNSNLHFVVVNVSRGYPVTDPAGYIINDPADGSTYKTLANYTDNGWTATNVIEYSPK